MNAGEVLALIVLMVCLGAPAIIETLSDLQGNRIKRLEQELNRLKREEE